MSSDAGREIEVGAVLLLPDKRTGFSSRDELRPCVVIAVLGGSVRVAAISQTRTDGLALPATPSNRSAGFILRPTALISQSDAIAASAVDALSARDFDQVLSFIEEELP